MLTLCGSKTSLIEVNCETDFVAKNDDFISFVKELSEINNNTIIFTHSGLLDQSFEVQSTTSNANIVRVLIFSVLAVLIYFFGRQVIKSK